MSLRTLILTFLFTIVVMLNVSGQTKGSLWYELGGNANSVWILNQDIYGNPELPYMTKFGMYATTGFNYFYDNKHGVNIKVGYGTFGQDYAGEMRKTYVKRKVTFKYMHIPVTHMWKVGKPNKPLWLEVGPQFSWLMDAKQEYGESLGGYGPKYRQYLPIGDTNVTKWFIPYDAQIQFRVTKYYKIKKIKFLLFKIGLDGAIGLLDINAKPYRIPNVHDIYGSSHNFYVGFQGTVMLRMVKGKFSR